jgi:hypothetical protein
MSRNPHDPTRSDSIRQSQANADGDRAELTTRAELYRAGGWQPGMTACRSGWPPDVASGGLGNTVTVLSRPKILPGAGGVTLVQVSHGGDVFWISIEELQLPEEADTPPVVLGQGDQRREHWPTVQQRAETNTTGQQKKLEQAIGSALIFLAGVTFGVGALVATAWLH